MYIDRRLWALTAGVRLRIAPPCWSASSRWSRASRGWPCSAGCWRASPPARRPRARVRRSWPPPPSSRCAACSSTRAPWSPTTRRRACSAAARRRLYDHLAALGPAHFTRSRTGDVILSLVEGVQQLEVYFGQYLPQLFVSGAHAPAHLRRRWPSSICRIALGLPGRRARHARRARRSGIAGTARRQPGALAGLCGLRRRVPRRHPGAGHAQGLRAEPRPRGELLARPRPARSSRAPCGVLGTNTLARGITDVGHRGGRGGGAGWGAYRVRGGEMELAALVVVLMLGVEVFRPLRELRTLLHQGMLGLVPPPQGVLALLALEPESDRTRRRAANGRRRGSRRPSAFEAVRFRYPGGRRAALEGLSFDGGARASAWASWARAARASPPSRASCSASTTRPRAASRIGGRDLRDSRPRRPAAAHRGGEPGHLSLPRHRRGQPPHGPARREPAELEAAARAANAHEFIAPLPQGYQTVRGRARGPALGRPAPAHRHRAGAAPRRAHPDPGRGALLGGRGERGGRSRRRSTGSCAGRTTLIFAHRLSSVIGADRILVLDEGRVAETRHPHRR